MNESGSGQKPLMTVPVLLNFDPRRQIGCLTLWNPEALGNMAEMVFAVGGIAEEKIGDKITKFTLTAVSPQTDEGYIRYLKSQGMVAEHEEWCDQGCDCGAVPRKGT